MSGVPLPGIKLIKQFEGCHLQAYPDPLSGGKPFTIGWGSTRRKDGSPFNLGEKITQSEADDLLMWQVEQNFLPALEKIPVWPELNENQQGALLSFAYNLGAKFYGAAGFETISRVLRERRWDQMESALLLYRNPGSSVEAGLRRRRQAEADLFAKPSGQLPTPVVSQPVPGNTNVPRPTTPRARPSLESLKASVLKPSTSKLSTPSQPTPSQPTPSQPIPSRPAPSQSPPSRATSSPSTPKSTPSPSIPRPSTSSPSMPSESRVLTLQQPPLSGEDVLEVQKLLARSGAGITLDGVFGPVMKMAVERFQTANGLKPDGVVGPQTLKLLKTRVLYYAEPPLQGADVAEVEQALVKRGFQLIADGVFDQQTQHALKAFQQAVGLIADGVLGPKTRQILFSRMLSLQDPYLTGEDVMQVQTAIASLGLAIIPDGTFGPGTDRAIRTFQQRFGLTVDGIVGPRTLTQLLSLPPTLDVTQGG